ncbi:capsule assembly Wzi family protein [Hymenobacter sp. H14-R3]|uniref:capsule assembly Wzi family protein n=1 Tax=Hymenobacter sp. H14-R3 TaxID=3046308 RepID=UPI0024B9FA71|nr:capsule assembly Wzi family protein [Hymenobacter sp. H14-R3]MDJ0365775.1 capsule assembly Wzi family protein [Hymenobacter sp. H14-R3]
MKYYLSFLLLALVGPLAAQTTPPQPNSANWYIFDKPLPPAPSGEKPVSKEPKADKADQPVIVDSKPTQPTAVEARPAPAVVQDAPALPARPGYRAARSPYQGPLYVPLDPNTYRLIDRYAIKYGPDSLQDPHTSARPYTRSAAGHLGEHLLDSGADLSAADRFNAQYLVQDNWMFSATGDSLNQSRKPFLKYFYRDQTDFYHVQTKDFSFRLNPVLLLQAGADRGTNSNSGLRYVNTRGVAFEGLIDQRLGFYGFLTDNQEKVPGWVQAQTELDSRPGNPVAPHEGYTKPFKGLASAYDFFTARGGITYAATRHINVQLAHDRNFIGNGYRSLILSDYSSPYFFLKLNTRVWKFNYQNIFAELTARRGIANTDTLYPKKYLALHHLSFDVTNNFNIGVFESEVSGGPGRGLELQYLNPLIFYRAIEQQVGSTDNALLGLDFKWNIKHRAQLYGQLVLDEFKIKEVLAGDGWWSNKQAIQLGGKLIDLAGIRNLDLQVEFNYIRPYTYQHTNIYTAYEQYQQPLAHPMGANLTEILGVLSYQPLPRLNLVAKAFYTKQGLDFVYNPVGMPILDSNYGSNPLLPYDKRPLDATGKPREYGYRVGDGNTSHLFHGDLTATYQPRLNLYLDASLIVRHQSINQPLTYTDGGSIGNGTEVYPSVALRWNIAQRLHEF